MAENEGVPEEAPKKRSKLPLLIGLLLMLALGGGGFYAVYSGLLFGSSPAGSPAAAGTDGAAAGPLPDIAFVPVDAIVVSLGTAARSTHLRFKSQLEVAKAHEAEVVDLMPRILDVINGYLRAVEVSEIEDPTALIRLRAQMLRRIQIVTGEGRVRDLLVTEFVMN